MRGFLFVIVALLLLGPWRNWLLRTWRFSSAALAGGLGGWMFASACTAARDPWWVPWLVSAMTALGTGVAFKRFWDEILGGKGR